MYNAPPPNLMQGIQLIQSGRRGEALPYLRYAVQHEPVTAEGWLWLAAATGDLEEYRYCVTQALRLDPQHPTAQRMRTELDNRARWGQWGPPAPVVEADDMLITRRDNTAARRRPSRRRRALRALVILLMAAGCAVGLAALLFSGVVENAARDWLQIEAAHTVEFTVGEQPGYRFRVEVPESWKPADSDNPSWRARRDELMIVFPTPGGQTSVWEQIEASFSRAIRDPVYGDLLPPVRLVETDEKRLTPGGMVAALTLQKIVPLPDPPDGAAADVCAAMRLLEQQLQAQAIPPNTTVVETVLAARNDLGDCIYAYHFRITDLQPPQVIFPLALDTAPDTLRVITLAVPVGTERYAQWQITLPDATYGDYAEVVERILQTLVYRAD
jgi:hypothetical protein